MEENLRAQRYVIQFCFKLKKTAKETLEMLREAYGSSAVSKSTCYEWYKQFKEGRASAELQGGPGAPTAALTEITINTGAAIIREDSRLTVRQLASLLGISIGSAHHLLAHNLNVSRVCARWIPRLLTPEQKGNRVDVCQYWKEQLRADPTWLDNVITVDETWIYLYDPETKQQSTQWVKKGGPPPKKARVSKSAAKTMIITFFDKKGMVYNHVVPRGQTVNAEYYVGVLQKLIRPHIQKKRPEYTSGRWKLHQDNARPHVAHLVMEFLSHRHVQVIPHPPYSPDLAPCDFYLYPTAKKQVKGRRFQTPEDAVTAVQGVLNSMSQNGFQDVFEKWQERWDKCIRLGGEYIEGENVDIV